MAPILVAMGSTFLIIILIILIGFFQPFHILLLSIVDFVNAEGVVHSGDGIYLDVGTPGQPVIHAGEGLVEEGGAFMTEAGVCISEGTIVIGALLRVLMQEPGVMQIMGIFGYQIQTIINIRTGSHIYIGAGMSRCNETLSGDIAFG